MECAGNGRAFLTPKASGTPWERGAVGTAEWTGVPLTAVLRRAGLKPSAREVIFEGADRGEIKDPTGPAGTVHYARSLSLQKASEDVLLVFKMNGALLTPAHGAPLRVIVPGWYGMASVKWLTRIIASAQPYQGYYQTIDYAFLETRTERTDPGADYRDAGEDADRPARFCRRRARGTDVQS
jgi:DMSO/TMAO reductase YedYZ molybdopterin-dependent catalytic subunit